MANEFFDGLGETLTRTAKELGERAEQIYESQKIRNKLSGEERLVDKIMMDLGNLIYKKHANGETLDEEFGVLCEEIDQHMQKMSEYKESMANIKGQKLCPSCQKAVDKEVSFCPYCGAVCPVPEPEEAAGDVVDDQNLQEADTAPEEEAVSDAEEDQAVDTEKTSEEDACCGSSKPGEKPAEEAADTSVESEQQ